MKLHNTLIVDRVTEYSKLFVAWCCLSSFPAFAQIEWQTSQSDLKLYGDVEFNIDAAYLISNVMDMDNFNIYLGSYWSHLSRDENQGVALIIVMVRG